MPLDGLTENQLLPSTVMVVAVHCSVQVPLLESGSMMGDGFGPPSITACDTLAGVGASSAPESGLPQAKATAHQTARSRARFMGALHHARCPTARSLLRASRRRASDRPG